MTKWYFLYCESTGKKDDIFKKSISLDDLIGYVHFHTLEGWSISDVPINADEEEYETI